MISQKSHMKDMFGRAYERKENALRERLDLKQ